MCKNKMGGRGGWGGGVGGGEWNTNVYEERIKVYIILFFDRLFQY